MRWLVTNRRTPIDVLAETARLREVQKILGDRVGRDVFIYSISIDPEHDTPKVLKEYAEKFQAGPDGFITVPDRPGLGLTLNEEFVKQYLVAESGG